MNETLSSLYGAFVKGRQSSDLVLVANEVVEDYHIRNKEGAVLKIDFEKAYDHVDWGFLDQVLERKGLVLGRGSG